MELSPQGGRPRVSPAVVGDGVQIFVKPPRRRASASGDDALHHEALAAKEPIPEPQSEVGSTGAHSALEASPGRQVLLSFNMVEQFYTLCAEAWSLAHPAGCCPQWQL